VSISLLFNYLIMNYFNILNSLRIDYDLQYEIIWFLEYISQFSYIDINSNDFKESIKYLTFNPFTYE
jgi:hypothetical protein